MFCQNCGNQIPDTSQTCPICGAPLSCRPIQHEAPAYLPNQAPQYPAPQMTSSTPNQAPYPHPAPQQTGFATNPMPATPTKPGNKRNRKIAIVAASSVLVIVLGIGGFFGYSAYVENQRSEAYAAANVLMDQGDYEAALAAFSNLEDYEDSSSLADYCAKAIAFEAARAVFDSGDYDAAKGAFADLGTFMEADTLVLVCEGWLTFEKAEALTNQGSYEEASALESGFSSIPEVNTSTKVADWRNRNGYGWAEQLLADGRFYGAYLKFAGLGSYEDAAARAESCVQAMPGNTEFYHHEGFRSSSTDLTFNAGEASAPYYIKVYSGGTVVSTLFLNPGGATTIQIPAGDYTFKSATGSRWFGESDMFGFEGDYSVMVFEDYAESVHLNDNMVYTVTMRAEGGNVSNRDEDPEKF